MLYNLRHWWPPPKRSQISEVLHHCNMKGVHITCGKVTQAFSLEPNIVPNEEALDTTRQAKLSIPVKEVWLFEVMFPWSQKFQKDRHTNKTHLAINILHIWWRLWHKKKQEMLCFYVSSCSHVQSHVILSCDFIWSCFCMIMPLLIAHLVSI